MRRDPRTHFSDGMVDDRRLHVAVRGESEAFRSEPQLLLVCLPLGFSHRWSSKKGRMLSYSLRQNSFVCGSRVSFRRAFTERSTSSTATVCR